MLFMTWIARVGDGLPLAASIPEDEESGKGVLDFQNQAKMLFRKLNNQSPSKCTIETGSHFFHYLIDQDVCYLVLCEQSYSKKLAFSFLEDLAQEFSSLYGKKVHSVNRPYSFIEFDTYIQKARRSFMDSRTRRNLTALNTELQDVQRIMVRNIDDVLQRGSLLSDLDNKAQNLSVSSQRYKRDARHLNMQSTYAKIGAAAIVMIVFVLYFWVLNVDDDEEIPGTVRIVLSAGDPQRTKNQVVFSIPDRCFIPATQVSNAIELFDQTSSSVYEEPEAEAPQQDASIALPSCPDTAILSEDGMETDASEQVDTDQAPDGGLSAGGPIGSIDTSRSDPNMTERDDDLPASGGSKAPKRKGAKGINHFSYCDRATQTTIPPVRFQGIQTEAPPRVSFGALTNAWIIHDSYSQDICAQQQKIQQQQAQDNIKPGGTTSSSTPSAGPTEVYWEDAADEYREPEGTMMPLWRFSPPAALLRMFEENGSMRSQVPSHVTSICWNPHYKDLFAMGLGSRISHLSCNFFFYVSSHHRYFKKGDNISPESGLVSWHGDTSDGNLRLFSVSMDGCLCLWLFVQGELYPTELITLPFQGDNRLDGTLGLSASCSCMAIHPSHSMVLVGTDQGQLWPVSNEGEILNWGPVTAHQGPVYTIQWNPFHPDVFITCSTDWQIKIWDRREKEALVVINLGSCVEDCAFSPFSSTAFACMSDQGKVFIFDLNICLHKPLCCQRVAPQRRAQPTKLSFGPFHPVILVGDDKGHATCLKLSPNLRKVSRVSESSRPIDVEIEKLERVITLMKK
uniref:EOG090X0HBC n=1 Tax=Alona affinis TaxID=381656 RepID=A0A9N6WU51_9CRUS|nr:EOG090X0HBC [Alona affinis]